MSLKSDHQQMILLMEQLVEKYDNRKLRVTLNDMRIGLENRVFDCIDLLINLFEVVIKYQEADIRDEVLIRKLKASAEGLEKWNNMLTHVSSRWRNDLSESAKSDLQQNMQNMSGSILQSANPEKYYQDLRIELQFAVLFSALLDGKLLEENERLRRLLRQSELELKDAQQRIDQQISDATSTCATKAEESRELLEKMVQQTKDNADRAETEIRVRISTFNTDINQLDLAGYFDQQSKSHSGQSRLWLAVYVLSFVGAGAYVLSLLDYAHRHIDDFHDYNFYQFAPLASINLLIFSLISAWLIFISKNYHGHMHQAVVSRFRVNLLRSIDSFSKNTEIDVPTKIALVIEAFRSVCSERASGFISKEDVPDSSFHSNLAGASSSRIVATEVAKEVTRKVV